MSITNAAANDLSLALNRLFTCLTRPSYPPHQHHRIKLVLLLVWMAEVDVILAFLKKVEIEWMEMRSSWCCELVILDKRLWAHGLISLSSITICCVVKLVLFSAKAAEAVVLVEDKREEMETLQSDIYVSFHRIILFSISMPISAGPEWLRRKWWFYCN